MASKARLPAINELYICCAFDDDSTIVLLLYLFSSLLHTAALACE